MRRKKYVERLDQLRDLAIKRYMRVLGTDSKDKREELEIMPVRRLFQMIDRELEKARSSRPPTCGTCARLYPSEWAVKYGYEDCPFYQKCSDFVNVNWKNPGRKRLPEYSRRPSNKACPNYVKGENAYMRKRREKGKE